jgi:hypothetical protein
MHIQESMSQIPPRTTSLDSQDTTTARPSTYASALINPPPHANLRIAAKEGIKARQILLDGIKESEINHMDPN